MSLTLLAVVALANYRVVRFLIDDTLLDELRLALRRRLSSGNPGIVRVKLFDLTTCPYCISVWTAAALLAAVAQFAPVALPVLAWLAVCGATMVVWRYVEG